MAIKKTKYLLIIALSLIVFNTNTMAADLDKNLKQRCDSLPPSSGSKPMTGPLGSNDPNIVFTGKMINGITHIFYPSGKLQRRGNRVDRNNNPSLQGDRMIGLVEIFDEECYLWVSSSRNSVGTLTSTKYYSKGDLIESGNITEDKEDGIWEYFETGALTRKNNYVLGVVKYTEYYLEGNELHQKDYFNKNGNLISAEFYEDGIVTIKGPGWNEDNKMQGIWEYFENGALFKKVTWEDGKDIETLMIHPSVTCKKLVQDFKANEMRALRKYQNKTFIISGRVTSVDADMWDKPQITLSDGEQWSFSSCLASPAAGEEFFYDFDKGELVKMQCQINGEIMGSPILKACVAPS